MHFSGLEKSTYSAYQHLLVSSKNRISWYYFAHINICIHANCESLILTHSQDDEDRFIIWNTSLIPQQAFRISYSVRWFHWNHKGRFLSVKMLHLCSVSTVWLFRCRSKKTLKLCLRGLCEGNPPSQKGSNMENVSIWWRHHDTIITE